MASEATTLIDIAPIVTAVAGILIAALVAVMPFARRPRLSLEEDKDRIHSRLEVTGRGDVPHIRLLAANKKRRRAAAGTRVLVAGYRPQQRAPELVSLAHPSLGWPSAPEAVGAALTIFAGGQRPIGFGRMIRVRLHPDGRLMRPNEVNQFGAPVLGFPHYPDDADAVGWYLALDLAFGLDLLDNRDKLPPVEGGYAVQLVIGADDGAARTFEVDVAWNGEPTLTADQVLQSVLNHLAVREI